MKWRTRGRGRIALVIGFVAALCACAPIWSKTSPDKREEGKRFTRLAQAQIEQGKTTEAVDSVNKAIAADPDNAEAEYLLGYLRHQQSDFKSAEKAFKRAIRINPYYTDAHNHLGIVYRENKEYDKALDEFKVALKDKAYRNPEIIHLNIGHLYLARDMYPEAIASFQQAVSINPAYARGHLGLGTAYTRAGQKDLADKELRKVVSLEPDSPEAKEARKLLDGKVKQAGS